MSWTRFQYVCRRYSLRENPQTTLEQVRQELDQDPVTDFYGSSGQNRYLINMLYQQANQLAIDKVDSMAKLYGNLKFNDELVATQKMNIMIAYLGLVSFVFFFVSVIYQIYVFPNFFELFESLDIAMPYETLFFVQNWLVISSGIFLFIAFVFLSCLRIRALNEFRQTASQHWLDKLCIPKSIRSAQSELLDVLLYPLQSKSSNPLIRQHLGRYSTDALQAEIEVLVQRKSSQLIRSSEAYLNKLILVVVILIVGSIYLFLSSAYAPIFILGETA
ncbi:hypothetical protein [Pleionea sp. CnH1-48]|uniref:hypothetical protein n=1 Tax=Pleionea sp. CnH1-48 TaxID=2954494 RepID=UPI002097D9C7|nr:hypothetical protein [Pleionea sp. CnH1-48]MCO7223430.1 hypothetical protein [Pleionea sp. CnH1-48]